MTIRDHNLETIAPVLATFKIHQTGDVDDLKDADIGSPVTLSGNSETGPLAADGQLLGKLISLTLTDADDGERVATVQIGGVCRLAITTPAPSVGNRVVGGGSGAVKQAPTVAADPDGGNIARGTVLEVNSGVDCLILLN